MVWVTLYNICVTKQASLVVSIILVDETFVLVYWPDMGIAGGMAGRASALPIFNRHLPFLISEVNTE